MTCLDENDTPPRFRRGEVEVRLSEAFLPGRSVGFVRADDPDLADTSGNGGLAYSIGASASARAFLEVDSATGELILRRAVDRERHSEVEVEVRVTDGAHEDVWKRTLQVRTTTIDFGFVRPKPKFDPKHFTFTD